MRSPYNSPSLLDALDQTIILLHENEACTQLSNNKIYLYLWSLLCAKDPFDLNGIRLPKPFRVYIIIAYHLSTHKELSRANSLISKLDEVENEMEDDEKAGFKLIKIVASLMNKLNEFREEGKNESSVAELVHSVLKNEIAKISANEKWVYFLKKIIEARLLCIIGENPENIIKEIENEPKPYEIRVDEEIVEGYNIFDTQENMISSSIYKYYDDELKHLKEGLVEKS